MLEDLAFNILELGSGILTLVTVAVWLGGFATAQYVRRDDRWSLPPVPHFVMVSALFAAMTFLPILWLGTFEALARDMVWVLLSASLLGFATLGYGYGMIARARALNAFGNPARAWLAIVPLANFWLLFAPTKGTKLSRPTAPQLAGGALGLLLIAAGVGATQTGKGILGDMIRRSQNDTQTLGVIYSRWIRDHGLEVALNRIAIRTKPAQVDQATTLDGAEVADRNLRFLYTVGFDAPELPDTLRTALSNQICRNAGLRPLLVTGATISHVYRREDGSEIGSVDITWAGCTG
ncbi:MAG: hypothetical protein HUJ27_08650 [Rhodobacteraceae bacterium]|nr:hypothetical protein [Paracoccaceae bacterium]